jgi:hypothetical protein
LAIDTLRELANGYDPADKALAISLLRRFGGDEGYNRLVGAALVGDAMVILGKFVNTSQAT